MAAYGYTVSNALEAFNFIVEYNLNIVIAFSPRRLLRRFAYPSYLLYVACFMTESLDSYFVIVGERVRVMPLYFWPPIPPQISSALCELEAWLYQMESMSGMQSLLIELSTFNLPPHLRDELVTVRIFVIR